MIRTHEAPSRRRTILSMGLAIGLAMCGWLPAASFQRLDKELFREVTPDLEAALGLLNDGQSEDAVARLRELAGAGNTDAAFAAAWLLHHGRGIAPDLEQAETLYRQAVTAGHPPAQMGLGLLLLNDEDEAGEKTRAEAMAAIRSSAEAGFTPAMRQLAQGHLSPALPPEDDPTEAVAWLEKAEAAGDPEAVYLLATVFDHGAGNVAQDPERAAFYFEKAAEAGFAPAQVALGRRLIQGAQPDPKAGVEWLRKATAQGSSQAMSDLAMLFMNGEAGLQKSASVAVVWLIQAAEHGDVEAQNALGGRYKEGDGVFEDKVAAAAWFARAAERGYAPAQVNLGLMFENGLGAPKNLSAAGRYYELAAQRGHPVGMFLLARLRAAGRGVSRDLEDAYLLAAQAAPRYEPAVELRDELRAKLTPEQLERVENALAERNAAGEDSAEDATEAAPPVDSPPSP